MEETPANTALPQDEDARLMLAAKDGDAAAFETLTLRNQERVRAFLLRMVGNLQLAEDLTQEVFLRIYRGRTSYRPDALFSTWLYRIVQNVAFNSMRAKRRRPETLFTDAGSGSASSSNVFGFGQNAAARSDATPTREIAKLELQAVVRAAVDSLAPRQRAVLLLARFEGMSYQEIADAMEMSPKAVKSLLC
ncbi:MAG: sigma-70 family RNA polymerase sigma factor, partial [Thermoguttaceae bacterium]|nr:sigma-70 family RNA polymerase sigma factor [Thermoguttaceae bacterium]